MRYLLSIALVLVPLAVEAQESPLVPQPSKLIISDRAIAAGIAATPPAQVNQRRDSVANGALIGAIVGAAIMGGYVTFLCNALQEPSDPSCLGSSLLAIGLGAGAGALGGAGVDALLMRKVPSPSTRR
jgi:hypothetical protein